MHKMSSMTATMLSNGSFVNGNRIEFHLARTSLLDSSLSLMPALVFAFSWTSRFLFNRRAGMRDAAVVAVVLAIQRLRLLYWYDSYFLSNSSILGLLITSITLMLITTVLKEESRAEWFGISQPARKELSQLDVRPLIIPCRTTHTRLFSCQALISHTPISSLAYLLAGQIELAQSYLQTVTVGKWQETGKQPGFASSRTTISKENTIPMVSMASFSIISDVKEENLAIFPSSPCYGAWLSRLLI